jgi:hypothetical protein
LHASRRAIPRLSSRASLSYLVIAHYLQPTINVSISTRSPVHATLLSPDTRTPGFNQLFSNNIADSLQVPSTSII